MSVPKLKYGIGNSASTTLSSSVTNTDTAFPLTSDTNFAAAPTPGEGGVVIDEGTANEEYAYATTKSGSSLTIPLANRGLEGTSAVGHSSQASVKGILSVDMYNDIIDTLINGFLQTTGAVDGSKIAKVTSNDIQIPTATGNIQLNGSDPKRGLSVPASGMTARTTNGAASGSAETATNKVMIVSYDFDQTTSEYVQFSIPAPKYWDLGTVTTQFHWTAASGSGTVTWAIQGLARSDDDALDTAFGTAQTVTDTLITANDEHITAATSAMTIGGTPAVGDRLIFQIYRDISDTLTADAKLLGVRVQFGISQYDDQ